MYSFIYFKYTARHVTLMLQTSDITGALRQTPMDQHGDHAATLSHQ